MVQVPVVTPVTTAPATVHTPSVVLVKATARPEVAVAVTVPVPPTTTLGAAPKLMVWSNFGVTLADADEARLDPWALVATTVKV